MDELNNIDEKLTKQIGVRFSETQYQELQKIAKEKNGQDSSENVKDKKENPEPEKKEQKSRGQHRKEAR